MHSFSDLKGRKWDVHLTLGIARKLKSQLGIDLLKPEDNQAELIDVLSNHFTLIEAVWIAIESDALAKSVSKEEFENDMDGETLDRAVTAFMEELSFFIQRVDPTRAKLLIALLQKSKAILEIQTAKVTKLLEDPATSEAIEAEMERLVSEATSTLRETIGKRSGNSPAQPA